MLLEGGHTLVGEADNATSAIQVIQDKKPHVVITDIVMPDVSGIELTEKINKTFDDIYVIVVSSLSQEHVIIEAIGAGASDFIPKPIQKQQLLDSLEKIGQQISKN